jgi:hypothetical protein
MRTINSNKQKFMAEIEKEIIRNWRNRLKKEKGICSSGLMYMMLQDEIDKYLNREPSK